MGAEMHGDVRVMGGRVVGWVDEIGDARGPEMCSFIYVF